MARGRAVNHHVARPPSSAGAARHGEQPHPGQEEQAGLGLGHHEEGLVLDVHAVGEGLKELDIPEGFCRNIHVGEAPGELTPVPADWTPLGPGPTNVGDADVLADQVLRDDANQAYYGWLGGVAQVASGPPESAASYDPPTNAFDDAIDALLGSGGSVGNGGSGADMPPPIGGGEAPGEGGGIPDIGGGEVPGEGIGGGEVPGEGA